MPVVAVLALWQFVAMWNSYFDAMIYLNSASKPVSYTHLDVYKRQVHLLAPGKVAGRGVGEHLGHSLLVLVGDGAVIRCV